MALIFGSIISGGLCSENVAFENVILWSENLLRGLDGRLNCMNKVNKVVKQNSNYFSTKVDNIVCSFRWYLNLSRKKSSILFRPYYLIG